MDENYKILEESSLADLDKKLKDEFSILSLSAFKKDYFSDLDYLTELIEGYCELFDLEVLRKRLNISLRKGMIATLQSMLVKESHLNRPRNSYDYKSIKNRAKLDYFIRNENWEAFPTLEEVHPSDPNTYYANDGKARGHYKKAILQIAANGAWMLKDDDNKIYSSLKNIFEDL